MLGNKLMAGRLSVWPPESASAVMSSARGNREASCACPSVMKPVFSNSPTNLAGGGLRNLRATSTRDTLAMIWQAANGRPRLSARKPANRYFTSGRVTSR